MTLLSGVALEVTKEAAVKTAKEVGKKAVKEVGKEIGNEVGKNSGNDVAKKLSNIDIHKRIDASKPIEQKAKPNVDISKRISSVDNKLDDTRPKVKEKITEHLITHNQTLENDRHPITGVPFVREVIDLGDRLVEGVFAKFESAFTTTLPENYYKESDDKQFKYCTEQLKKKIESNPKFAEKFTPRQLEQIKNGEPKISGYTWHHNQKVGVMELVDADIHAKTGHSGGRSIWGGGSDYR